MKSEIWGSTAWIYLHLVSLNYPDNPNKKDIEDNKLFLEYFGKTLPCVKCQHNFTEHMGGFNLNTALESKTNYINFVWKLHNKVNKDLNKPEISFNDYIILYKSLLDIEYINPIKQFENIDIYRKIILVLSLVITGLLIVIYRK